MSIPARERERKKKRIPKKKNQKKNKKNPPKQTNKNKTKQNKTKQKKKKKKKKAKKEKMKEKEKSEKTVTEKHMSLVSFFHVRSVARSVSNTHDHVATQQSGIGSFASRQFGGLKSGNSMSFNFFFSLLNAFKRWMSERGKTFPTEFLGDCCSSKISGGRRLEPALDWRET